MDFNEEMAYVIVVAKARDMDPSTSLWSSVSASDAGPDRSEIYDVLRELVSKTIFTRISEYVLSCFFVSRLTAPRDHTLPTYSHLKESATS